MKAIKAEMVLTPDGFRADRAVVIEGDRIEGLAPTGDLPRGAEVEDWGRVALVPGTINAHGHAFQSLLKGFADDRAFGSWRDDVLYPFSARLGPDGMYAGALLAFAEALLAGATTTVDFFYLHDEGNTNAEQVLRAARDLGIRLVFARAFYDPAADTAAPARYREPAGDAAERCRALAVAQDANPAISVQPAPHSLHAASPETLAVARDLARDLGVPWHLHLAEAVYEVELITARYGTTPVRLLDREGLLENGLVAIHGVWLDDDELDLLAASGAAVVHCPGANAFLGDGVARLPEMLERGIRVALGPDGGCANNRQSVFDEMRSASLFAKARLTDGGAIDAAMVFGLGTVGGADALRIEAGAIAPGRFADLVALDLDDLSLQPTNALMQQIVNSMQPTAIAKVMVGGEVVVANGSTTRVDLADVRAAVADVTAGWTRP